MKGSIRKRGNSYQYRISYRINDKRFYIEKSGFKLKKDCEAAMNKAIKEILETGTYVNIKKMSFEELFNEFITVEAPLTRKETTIKRYKSLYKNNFKSVFENKYVHLIKAPDIQAFYLAAMERLSSTYVRSMHNLFLVLFNYAIRMEYIKENIMDKVIPPKDNRSEIQIYTLEELEWISERLKDNNMIMPFMLGMHLGLRTGETYALRWSDIDFQKNTVKIDKQVQKIDGEWCFDTLKTTNSYRTITFGDVLKKFLLEAKVKQEMYKKSIKLYKTNKVLDYRDRDRINIVIVDDFVNIKSNGEKLTPHSNKVISRICIKEKGINFKYHNLRHTHATLLLEKGLNPKYIQTRLGHSKLETTLRLYTHVTTKMEERAAEIADEIYCF